MAVESLVRIVRSFSRELKNVQNEYCLVIYGLLLAVLLKFQPYHSDAIAFIGLQYRLENDCRKLDSKRVDSL